VATLLNTSETSNAPEVTPSSRPAVPNWAGNWRQLGWGAAIIVLAVFAVYWPALGGQFLWDDVLVVHRNPLVTGEMTPGTVWFRIDFPLTYIAFWLEWLLWGNQPIGYHLLNVLLHAASALLLWRVLAQLRIPAPWLAAMLFAVHPLCVGSVAWISELKNTLSLPFSLLSLLWYLQADSLAHPTLPPSSVAALRRVDAARSTLHFCLSLLAFLLALLAKTSTVMLPFVLLACTWWQRRRLTWRDGLRAGPYFAIALVFGLMTLRFQAHGAISGATVQIENFWGRLAGAGMALWFYLRKTLLPLGLSMIYPRWRVDAAAPGSYLPLLLWCGLLAACWQERRSWGRPVLFALGCFTVLLLPVLGFFDMYFLVLSRVSDHFVYLPLTALVPLAAAGLSYGLRFICPAGPTANYAKDMNSPSPSPTPPLADATPTVDGTRQPATGACPQPFFPVFSVFRGLNPLSASPGGSLGSVIAVVVVVALAVLAMARARVFGSEEALWRDTLRKNPAAWLAHANLGWILASHQRYDEAKMHLLASLELNPNNPQAHSNLGRLLSLQGKPAEADEQFQTALRLKPKDTEIRRAYATVLSEEGRLADAVAQLREALQLRPDTDTGLLFASLCVQIGEPREAVAQYLDVLKTRPDQPEALNNLAWLLATAADPTVRNGAEAVRFAEHACRITGGAQPQQLGTVAAAYAEAGRFPEAVAAAQKAVKAARAGGNDQLAAMGEQLLNLFRAGQPYREPATTPASAGPK
jgi:Flp pilus assembly protein TadD